MGIPMEWSDSLKVLAEDFAEDRVKECVMKVPAGPELNEYGWNVAAQMSKPNFRSLRKCLSSGRTNCTKDGQTTRSILRFFGATPCTWDVLTRLRTLASRPKAVSSRAHFPCASTPVPVTAA